MLVIPLNIAFIVRLVTTMAPASDLSPAAQAVLDAAYRRMDDNPHNEVEATLAAALRAAADQDETLFDINDELVPAVRTDHLLAIAAELEANG